MQVNPPEQVRVDHNLPDGSLTVVSAWAMPAPFTDVIGVWLRPVGEKTGRVYPVPGVSRAEVLAWEHKVGAA